MHRRGARGGVEGASSLEVSKGQGGVATALQDEGATAACAGWAQPEASGQRRVDHESRL
jgi:hypothetical protein